MTPSEQSNSDPDGAVEAALDDAASAVHTALLTTPNGSWAALLLTNVHEQLVSAANHVSAFGIGPAEPADSRS